MPLSPLDARRLLGRAVCLALAVAAALTVSAAAVRAAAPQADAQQLADLSLEDLMRVQVEQVFGASKRLQPATEAPSSVSIITAADIERYGYHSLADILRGQRAMYITSDRNYSYLGARGFAQPGDYNTRVLLLVDGHRLNDDVFDQAGIGQELGLDPSTFARVEIIRGPASALYGTSAFFAVVNITTRRGADIKGVSAGVDGGSLGRRRVYGSAGTTFANGVDVAVSANVDASDGYHDLYYPEFDNAEANDGHAIDVDAERMRGVSGHLSFKDVSVVAAYGWRRKDVPTAAFDTIFNDPHFNTIDERAFVDASYEHGKPGSTVSLRAYADMYNYDGVYPYASLVDGGATVLQTDYGHGVWWGTDARVSRALAGHQTLTAGAEWRDYARQDQGLSFEDDRTPAWATHVSTDVFAGYLQDEIRLRQRWLVTAGGRYDAYAGFGQFSPRASVVFAATPTRSFKYLFGTAFRAPNAYELDYLTDGVRNMSLGAEALNTTEVAWEEYVGGWLRTSVSAYRNSADRLITLVSDDEDVLHYVNAGRVLARGVELEAEVKTAAGVDALASYAWQHARDRDSDADLVNSPHQIGKLRTSVGGLGAQGAVALEVLAMSGRRLLTGGEVAAHAIANASYVQPLGPRVTLTASIRNLFDTRYADPASEEHVQAAIPQDGRTFRVGLRWNWRR
jgi:iron complex outermembrane receptor protein